MYKYKDLGLSNTKEMFAKANKEGYAVPAFNFNNMEMALAIVEACAEMGSPVILQCSKGALNYMGADVVPLLAKAAVDRARNMGSDIPVALHLDHGPDIETVKTCIEAGFSSVMIDGSHYDFAKNIEVSKEVVEYAHKFDVTVEAELGVLAGIEDDVKAESHTYTNPDEVEEFVNKTGVDSLAIAIGTSHGAHKFKPGEDPKLRLDILEEIERRIPGFPIVLHGSSAVPKQYTDMIKEFGGEVKDAIGIPNAELRKASKSAVAKINVDTDGRLAFTAAIRRVLGTTPKEFDPRKYLGAAKDEMKAYYKTKIVDVFGSEGAYKKGTK
ncbi:MULTISPECIES: class II fructose-bisphosphate aldolase [Fusobacterium]|jgi:fructose-bisphosphate aldolase class II|uniref:Fructose-1,6-bisphosphate aldolase, class II n=1 Tax=Fusobacterium varium ATCC 27725 TaxID=469618 RepID=A0ABN5JD97_FUSVA|nr:MULTISPECIES: class II fructose-bisphosphate aldolase [Fusobacterium]AVQ29682.1 fructose-1,6-bisphosphate aldolase, class II [Fusobacterium varium ATCC 27725]EES64460.1 fructose-1,6-bisphosphate aldolase, class II [Fusobacterium varium ATCC 27725]MCF0169927.1 class II fructose-1,6-bisphosphate aldolase [Fusobacterium varium]MCF2672865.1 class II fructose-1,6-bisphosphate aldolase [Fusobacterium varium]MCI6033740.1 class II fructose-1,6-bisphosphate aldolase [Fusobacterium varium]